MDTRRDHAGEIGGSLLLRLIPQKHVYAYHCLSHHSPQNMCMHIYIYRSLNPSSWHAVAQARWRINKPIQKQLCFHPLEVRNTCIFLTFSSFCFFTKFSKTHSTNHFCPYCFSRKGTLTLTPRMGMRGGPSRTQNQTK